MSATAISLASGIAIVGLSCRISDATDLDDYWKKLLDGHDSCREVPKDVFDIEKYTSPNTKNGNSTRVRIGNWLSDARWQFDAPLFGMTEAQALALDPEQRLALIVSQEALDMAGYSAGMTSEHGAKLTPDPSRIGVFFASTCDDYRENLLPQHVDGRFCASVQRQYLAHRIQEHWGFQGPAIVVDTVCSSSLVALDVACTSIRRGECDAAVVGGVNIITQPMPTIGLSTDHFLSETGTCKTFDAAADGYSRGEAIGVVVLKRLTSAIQDKDNILGVLMSIGTNHSGESISLTFPHMPAQLALMRANLDVAGVSARAVTLVEAHGTGTQAGDPCELEAIRTAFVDGERRKDEFLAVTTNKANFGHSEASSGICSLIKAIIEIKTGIVPPHIGVRTKLNPALEHLTGAPIQIAFQEQGKVPRCDSLDFVTACVNNFGAAGGNTSLLVRGPSAIEQPRDKARVSESNLQLIFVSANTVSCANRTLASLRTVLQDPSVGIFNENTCLDDVSYTTVARRPHYTWRKAFLATSMQDACHQMNAGLVEWKRVEEEKSDIIALDAIDESVLHQWAEELETCQTFRAAHQNAKALLVWPRDATRKSAKAMNLYALSAVLIAWGFAVEVTDNDLLRNGMHVVLKQETDLDTLLGLDVHASRPASVSRSVDKMSLHSQCSLRPQLLRHLSRAFEVGMTLNWAQVQTDVNPDARTCVLPGYPFEMKTYAVVYKDLGIADPVWGENPIRVLRRPDGEAEPLINLGLFSARRITTDSANVAYQIEQQDNVDISSVFVQIAVAAVCHGKQSMQGLRMIGLRDMVIKAKNTSLSLAMLYISHAEDNDDFLATLTIDKEPVATASLNLLAHNQYDWDSFSIFLGPLRHLTSWQRITQAVVRRILGNDQAMSHILTGTLFGRDSRSALLQKVTTGTMVQASLCLAELLVNVSRLGPNIKKMQASVETIRVLANKTGGMYDTYDLYATSTGQDYAQVLLLSDNLIVGEVNIVLGDLPGKRMAEATRMSVAQDVSALKGDGPVSAMQHQHETQAVTLQAAAKIIEAEVGVDVTQAENASTSFASLGVDSLMSLLLLDRMREVVPFELPRSLFFDYDDWVSLAAFLVGSEQGEKDVLEEATVVAHAVAAPESIAAPVLGDTWISNLDATAAEHHSALATSTSTVSPESMSSITSEQNCFQQIAIKTLGDVDVAISTIESVLGPAEKMFDRKITPPLLSQLQQRFVAPLPLSVFRPENTNNDVRSILSGPIHAASMVRRSSVLGGKVNHSTQDQMLFLIPDGSGSAAVFNTIPKTERRVFALNSPYLGDKAPAWKGGVVEIAAAYIYQMKERQPHGPYLFGGWSYGGIVSYEIARQLLADGEKVIGILLLDAPCPQHYPPLPCEILEWGQKSSTTHGQQVPQFPPALVRHFAQAIESLHFYEPPPLLQDAFHRRDLMESPLNTQDSALELPLAALFTAADGVPVDPKLVPNTNITVEWLFSERRNLGPQGWDRLFGQGRVEVTDIPGTHFTMMELVHATIWWSRVEETIDRWLEL